MKIVIDTNLLINGSQDDYNYGNRIIEEVLAGKLEAYANHATLAENRLLAQRKIPDQKYLEKLESYFAAVKPIPRLPQRLHVVRDPEDNKILESAVAAGAEYLVTSDRDLLILESYDDIEIVTPEVFWNKYTDSSGSGWQEWVGQFMRGDRG